MTIVSTPDTAIGITVPAQTLHYIPGGDPTHFVVVVVNQSDRFATVQLDLVAPGAEGVAAWYDLTPEISSKKPPGDRTEFHISILKSPIPGFAGLMNLTVRVTSMELGEERRILRLYVDPGGELPIGLKMPLRQFQASPLEQVQIPVFLENLSQERTEAILRLEGIPAEWVVGGAERTVDIAANSILEAALVLQLPDYRTAICRSYPFTLRATQPGGTTSALSGTLDVTAQGHVLFACHPSEQTLPVGDRHYRWGKGGVQWDTSFENVSNVPVETTLHVTGDDRPCVALQVNPDRAWVQPGESIDVRLGAIANRPWIGLGNHLEFIVNGTISDPRVDVRHSTQLLRLRSFPLIPLWLQGMGSFLVLYLFWWFSWLNPSNPFFGHRAAVNSVEINGVAAEMISGSSDQTSILWRVDGFFNPLANQQLGRSPDAEKAIRVVRYRPVNNDWIAAGLENGEIQLRSLSGQGHTTTFSLNRDDRVMDLAFTEDSRNLLSGHGSGAVLRWPIDYPQGDRREMVLLPTQLQQFNFAIYGISLVGREESTLAVGGRYNRLSLWDWQQNTVTEIAYPRAGSQADYITSVEAVFFNPYLLATADNQGYITLWDLKPCLISTRPCKVIDEWSNGHGGKPVRDVALSPYGCYLASAGADGRVKVWPLSSSGTRSAQYQDGIVVGRSRTPVNAVDIKIWNNHMLIAFGSENSQVSIRRRDRIHNALCDLPSSP